MFITRAGLTIIRFYYANILISFQTKFNICGLEGTVREIEAQVNDSQQYNIILIFFFTSMFDVIIMG